LLIFDVIVIGLGPAGSAAAVTCLHAGLKVGIVTADTEQHVSSDSPQGALESIHPGVSSLLQKIGLAGSEKPAVRSSYNGIYTHYQYAALGEDETGVWQGMHIDRRIFNGQLVRSIEDLGISIFFNQKVEDIILENGVVVGIRTKTKELHAKYIIDASGKEGIAGKKLKWKRQFFSPPLICWTGISAYKEPFPFDLHAAHFISAKSGWTWLAPLSHDLCAWTRLGMKGEKNMVPPVELKNGDVVGKIQFGNMRWRMFRPVCSEGILLCGDAAGILDPAAGQGIFNALNSGMYAAHAVIACVQQPAMASFHLALYDDWFVQQFEAKVKQLQEYYLENGIGF